MSVYVDGLLVFGGDDAPRCFRNKPSCHMYADTLDELHAMALRVGLKRSWFQNSPTLPHYDLTEGRRAVAIKLGVVEHNRYQAVATWKKLRGRDLTDDEQRWLACKTPAEAQAFYVEYAAKHFTSSTEGPK